MKWRFWRADPVHECTEAAEAIKGSQERLERARRQKHHAEVLGRRLRAESTSNGYAELLKEVFRNE